MEKQNKTVRQKRKKEDLARIRTLVGIYSRVTVSTCHLLKELT